MAASWCSLRCRADDGTGRAGRRLRPARGRCFAVICRSPNPIRQSIIDYALPEPYTSPLLHPLLAVHRPSCTGDPRNHGILVD